jgi:hypothetical protein
MNKIIQAIVLALRESEIPDVHHINVGRIEYIEIDGITISLRNHSRPSIWESMNTDRNDVSIIYYDLSDPELIQKIIDSVRKKRQTIICKIYIRA